MLIVKEQNSCSDSIKVQKLAFSGGFYIEIKNNLTFQFKNVLLTDGQALEMAGYILDQVTVTLDKHCGEA